MDGKIPQCVKYRLNDMDLPTPDSWFTSVASFGSMLRIMAAAAKAAKDAATLGEVLEGIEGITATAGLAAGAEVALTEVLALSFAFYFGALVGALTLCSLQFTFGGKDWKPVRYSKVSTQKIKQYYHKYGTLPDSVVAMLDLNPELRGYDLGTDWDTRLRNYGYGSGSSSSTTDTAYA